MDYAFVRPEGDEDVVKDHQKNVQSMVKNGKFDLKMHALRYEEIIRKHKEEQRRQHLSQNDTEEVPVADEIISYKSRLHDNIKRQEREMKEQQIRAFSEKQLKAERAKNYAKNVKDMYMPRHGSSKVLPNLPGPNSMPNR